MESFVWVVCKGFGSDQPVFQSVFSTKEKAMKEAKCILEEISFTDSDLAYEDDQGEKVKLWHTVRWRYDPEDTYYVTIEKCKVG